MFRYFLSYNEDTVLRRYRRVLVKRYLLWSLLALLLIFFIIFGISYGIATSGSDDIRSATPIDGGSELQETSINNSNETSQTTFLESQNGGLTVHSTEQTKFPVQEKFTEQTKFSEQMKSSEQTEFLGQLKSSEKMENSDQMNSSEQMEISEQTTVATEVKTTSASTNNLTSEMINQTNTLPVVDILTYNLATVSDSNELSTLLSNGSETDTTTLEISSTKLTTESMTTFLITTIMRIISTIISFEAATVEMCESVHGTYIIAIASAIKSDNNFNVNLNNCSKVCIPNANNNDEFSCEFLISNISSTDNLAHLSNEDSLVAFLKAEGSLTGYTNFDVVSVDT
ncbi:hypothetical protein SNEBB_003079 [Seison nebaliae]|nr:hypothetical protein SNEBB_003079 [Seison nebaliae]